ncbi:hypothetical protein JCM10207_008414 [Rhodosporidiobolus poonsookiae]
MQRTKPPEYYTVQDVNRLAREAQSPLADVVRWLEQRDAEWVRRHGELPLVEPDGVGSAKNGGAAPQKPPIANKPSSLSSSQSTAPRPPLGKTPSQPTVSLAERMAALRVSGLPGATPASSNPPSTLPPSSPKRAASPAATAFASRLSSTQPRSPPGSPRGQRGDLAADDAASRSGSAPPVLPYSAVQEAATVWAGDALQFRQEGGTPIAAARNGVVNRGPAGGVDTAPQSREPHSDSFDPPSPSKFASSFPSLDDFERGVDNTSSPAPSLPAFPSAPSFDPATTTKAPRPPPPQPPKPQHIDARTFEREQRERADAMAKLAAGLNPSSASSSSSSSSTTRNSLPPALVPGGARPPPPAAPLPPPSASSRTFNMPFSTEVRPTELYQYLQTSMAEQGQGPRVLLLDVRSRDEYERGRIKGEVVCLEPVVLRNGIKSSEIEDALALSPPHEAALFAARNHYDIVVLYDRSSKALPTAAPTATTSDAQRTLWNLMTAIYDREFVKSLKRQPLLLRGGWEEWERQVGVAGSTGTAVTSEAARPRPPREGGMEREDAKKANRRAAVLPSVGENGGLLLQNGHASDPPRPAPGYYSPSDPHDSRSFSPHASASGMVSPRLAMPPVAAQRSGAAPAYDPFASTSFQSRPSYPQPQLEAYSSPSGSPSMPRTRSDVVDLYAASNGSASPYVNGDYSRPSFEYSRPPIDYPQLHSRAPPPVSHGTRPPPLPAHAPIPAAPLTRPPPVKPAPLRSNSSFSSVQLAQYSSVNSRYPTIMSFDEGVIGLTGLKNLGNTCYMNSTIQCLSAAIPFARYFTSGGYRKDINVVNPLGTKGALANAVAELIRELWTQRYNFLSPVTFREQICRVAPQFRGSDQHDAQEFLGFLLDGLHEDCNYVVKKPPPIEMTPEREHDLETLPPQLMSEREWQIYKMRNDSFIVQCFQGQFRNQLRCLTCQKTSTTYNTFMPLSVPIPGNRSISKVPLMACLENFVRDEILDKDDAWHCPRCKKNRKAIKKLSLSKLPPILVIHLKRFSFHGPFSDKIETQVQFPLSGLDLTPFIPPPLTDKRGQPINPPPAKGYVYDLFGVTNHYGNLSSGHYTAYVRSGHEWNDIGDSKVRPCDPAQVQSAKSAYILYYALRT